MMLIRNMHKHHGVCNDDSNDNLHTDNGQLYIVLPRLINLQIIVHKSLNKIIITCSEYY